MATPRYDVIVIGAGAAGLMATAELAQAGRSVLLLEARDRIGGRIWTRSEPDLATPLELGAEFIHGPAELTRTLLARGGGAAIEVNESHRALRDGQPSSRADYFSKVLQAARDSGVLEREDVSFDALLDRHLATRLSREEREAARRMAQGFDAADTRRASARAIIAEWSGDTLGNTPQARPQGGYRSLLAVLSPTQPAVRLQLQATVRTVRWSPGAVEVAGEAGSGAFRARAARALVTLPLGVLQQAAGAAGAVRFVPRLADKQAALRGLASGPVVKLLLRFATPFWESVQDGRYREVSFFHSAGAPIPTFWTPVPARAPLLVGWAGGPQARRVGAGASRKQLVQRALGSVHTLFGAGVDAAAQLQALYYHDWQRDPFARGAYSYVTVGADSARATLGRPLAATLYFAGEATDTADEAGTVTGALQSGLRAAHEILAG
jgi:monoamine oxidase